MGKSRLLFDAERDDGRKRSDSVGHFRQAAEDDVQMECVELKVLRM